MEFYLMADSSTTVAVNTILFAGGCWARRQLRNGIRYVPVALQPTESVSFVEAV